MKIDLSDDAVRLAESLATDDKDAAAVIVEALTRLAWERQEVAAVEEGIEAYRSGRHRPVEEFMIEFMLENGITPPL